MLPASLFFLSSFGVAAVISSSFRRSVPARGTTDRVNENLHKTHTAGSLSAEAISGLAMHVKESRSLYAKKQDFRTSGNKKWMNAHFRYVTCLVRQGMRQLRQRTRSNRRGITQRFCENHRHGTGVVEGVRTDNRAIQKSIKAGGAWQLHQPTSLAAHTARRSHPTLIESDTPCRRIE
jgi:hypothetical protein